MPTSLNTSDIGGSGGCSSYLYGKLKRRRRNSGSGSKGKSGSEAQLIGTGVHEIIQSVLEHDPKDRDKAAEKMFEALEDLRKKSLFPDLIKNAIPFDEYYTSGVIEKRAMNTWKEAKPLLIASLSFLNFLEENVDGSKGKWKIHSEPTIHKNKGGFDHSPPSIREFFNEEIELIGYIDLVFIFNQYAVMGELKTGSTKKIEEKKKNWIRQVQVYSDVWAEKNPQHQVSYVVIHKGIKDGYQWGYKFSDWNDFNDQNHLKGGIQCRNCLKNSYCSESESNFPGRHFL